MRVLAWSDCAITGTGFGVVSKYVLTALHNTGKYDIHHLAINFHGDFVDKQVVPWQMQPAKLLDPNDPHGIKMFQRTLMKNDYDIVWILNDLYVTREIVAPLREIKRRMIAEGRKVPTFIYYYPVDCRVPEDSGGMVLEADIPVCYTSHGKEETLLTYPDVKNRLREIPHGVDTKVFHPIPLELIWQLKEQYFGVPKETTVVINVNRNSTRKQMQYSMLAFREFKKQVPTSVMYLHTAVRDQGGDLIKTIAELGMSYKSDIIFPTKYSPSNPAPAEVLNRLYNAGDIFLTTHLGEGWGLSLDPYTHINTTEGIKYLKDIQIGDKVLTSTGLHEEVLDTTSREENIVFELAARYSVPLITSELHPYLSSSDRGKTLEWKNVKKLSSEGDYIAIVKPKDAHSLPSQIDLSNFIDCKKDEKHVWLKMGYSPNRSGLSIAKVMREFDVSKRVAEDALNKFQGKNIPSRCLPESKAFIIFQQLVNRYAPENIEPIKMNRFIPIDDTFLEFIGWYLAEGSSENGVRIELSLHRKEKHIAEKFQTWCKKSLGIDGVVEVYQNKSRLRISNNILAKFMQQECGQGSYNKHIPSWLIETPTKLGPLMKGLFQGDGSVAESGYLSLTTTSPSLAYHIRDICASAGVLVSIATAKCRGNYVPFVLSFKHRQRFGDFIGVPLETETQSIDCIELDDYFLVPIIRICRRDNNTELLYDICVENSHSFVANGILAHNTVTEAMAAGTPVVAPNNTSMPQQLGKGSQRGYMYPCKDQLWIDQSGFRKKGLIPDIVKKMMQAYNDGHKYKNPKVLAARNWTKKHDWNEVTKQWVSLFDEARSGSIPRVQTMGESLLGESL